MINRISNLQSVQNPSEPSFKAARLKINKASFGLQEIDIKLPIWQEQDVLTEITKRFNSGDFKLSSENTQKNFKTFKSQNGDSLVLQKDERDFPKELILKSEDGNEEINITPEGINSVVRSSFQSLANNFNLISM